MSITTSQQPQHHRLGCPPYVYLEGAIIMAYYSCVLFVTTLQLLRSVSSASSCTNLEVLWPRGVVSHADGHQPRKAQVLALLVHVPAQWQHIRRLHTVLAGLATGVHLGRHRVYYHREITMAFPTYLRIGPSLEHSSLHD